MSTRTATVRRQKRNDKNVRMVTNSKAHLRALAKIHDELIESALAATKKVVETCQKYQVELASLDVKPMLMLIAAQIRASSAKHEAITIRINAMSSKNGDPLIALMDILEELNEESMKIASSISDPLMDIMNDMNKRLPIHDQFDMGAIEDLLEQLDTDVAANSPVATTPETNRVMY